MGRLPPDSLQPSSAEQAGPTAAIAPTLERWNLPETLLRAVIERIWAALDQHDDWGPLEQWLERTSAASADAAPASGTSE